MSDEGHVWAVLLAAGEGHRVRSFTCDANGGSIPKQFWALGEGDSLLRWAVRRASRLVLPQRIVAVVAEGHRCWWEPDQSGLDRDRLVVQPENRGTAAGILLPVLEVLRRDPRATVVVLPTDHFVDDEAVLHEALVGAVAAARARPERVVLVGMDVTGIVEGYGWILPAGMPDAWGTLSVAAFVEKPEASVARDLARRGALLNSFIFVSSAAALLRLYARALPRLLEGLLSWSTEGGSQAGLRELYASLAPVDFSRDVLEPSPDRLSVLPVAGCGWLDLGVPERLLPFLRRPLPDGRAADSVQP